MKKYNKENLDELLKDLDVAIKGIKAGWDRDALEAKKRAQEAQRQPGIVGCLSYKNGKVTFGGFSEVEADPEPIKPDAVALPEMPVNNNEFTEVKNEGVTGLSIEKVKEDGSVLTAKFLVVGTKGSPF